MDVTQLPFNQLIGLQTEPASEEFLVVLPAGEQYTNHLGTVHAGALLAVAEAASGAFLLQQFPQVSDVIPVVRHLDAKFRTPARGRMRARCPVDESDADRWLRSLTSRGRLSATIPVEVVDDSGTVVMNATVDWFVSRA